MSLCLFILTDFCRLRILRHKHGTALTKVLDLFLVTEQSLFLPLGVGHSLLSMKALHGWCPDVASSYNFLQFLAAAQSVDNNTPATLCHTMLTIMPPGRPLVIIYGRRRRPQYAPLQYVHPCLTYKQGCIVSHAPIYPQSANVHGCVI